METRRQLIRRLGWAALAGLASLAAMRRGAGATPAAATAEPDLDRVDGWVLRADDRASPRAQRGR